VTKATGTESLAIKLREDGKWSFEAIIPDGLGGIRLKGSGSWVVSKGTFEFTIEFEKGPQRGKTPVRMEGPVLVFADDPVLSRGDSKIVESRYVRAK